MRSNYDVLGKHIRLVDFRNKDEVTNTVLGISINKEFMPSVANVIGTDLSRYKLIQKGMFACNPMHVGRDERLPIALYKDDIPAIVSPAYFMFEIIDPTILDMDYLMMWFRRPEFDRECWFMTDGSVRGGITWDDLCRISIPVPPIEKQRSIVKAYQTITDRIALKQKINDNLFATVNAFFKEKFSRFLHEDMRNLPNYVRLKNFIKIKHGYAFDGEQFSEDETSKILVSPGNFKIGGGFQNSKPKFYKEEAEFKAEYVLKAGSLVVTMTDLSKNGDTLGFPAVIPKDERLTFLHNQRVGLVEFIDNTYSKAFIYFLMCSSDYRNYILATASGTTVRHTSPDKILGYGFITPDNKSDLIMLNRLYEAYLSDCNIFNIEIQRLTELQSTLLSKLVS